jgi:hypothetical protein
LGISLAQVRDWTKAGSRRRLSDNIARKERRSRKSRAAARARGKHPEFKRVLDHFRDVLPEQVWCPKRICGSVLEKHRELGILPKSVADLELILRNPSEQKGIRARCWICLYRSYRELYRKLNGEYPVDAPDVSDDFADRFTPAASHATSSEESSSKLPEWVKTEYLRQKKEQAPEEFLPGTENQGPELTELVVESPTTETSSEEAIPI